MSLTAVEIAQAMLMPGFKRIYGIVPGPDGDPVSFYSQQLRAFNLAWSLAKLDLLRRKTNVSIVGAGLAGVTMAAAARMLGCEVTLFEQGYQPFHQQRGNFTRFVHPNLIDWPRVGSELDHTDLPFLNWSADSCNNVIQEIELQWELLRPSVNLQRNMIVSRVDEDDQSASITVESPYGRWKSDLVVFCAGLGPERQFQGLPTLLYWDNDKLHQPQSTEGKRLLISGIGDGGLIDAMRVLFRNFDHGYLLAKVVQHSPLAELKDEVLEVEKAATAVSRDKASSIIWEGYEKLRLEDRMPEALKDHTNGNSRVTLNARADTPLDLNASVVNRVIIYALIKWQRVTYVRGEMLCAIPNGTVINVTFRDKVTTTHEYDQIIIRHGPAGRTFFDEDIHDRHRKASGTIRDAARTAFWNQRTFEAALPLSPDYLKLTDKRAGRYRQDFKTFIEQQYGPGLSVEIGSNDDGHAIYVVGSAASLQNLPKVFARIPVVNRRPRRPHSHQQTLDQPSWMAVMSIEPAEALKEPTGIAIDGNGIYVTDHSLNTLMRIDDGKVVKSRGGLNRPHHITAVAGKILVADTYNNQIICFDPNLKELWRRSTFDGSRLSLPHGVGCTTADEFYILDSSNGRVVRVQGKRSDIFGRPGRPGTGTPEPGEFVEPCGLAVGPQEIYVADTHNHRIQMFDRTMRYVAAFGAFGRGEGEFAYPVGIASWQNWIVIADELNARLQLWSIVEKDSTPVATCIQSSLCDPWLKSPFGLVFNRVGDLYVADRHGGKVLKINMPEMLRTFEPE